MAFLYLIHTTFFRENGGKEEDMEKVSRFATNKGGIIEAPRDTKSGQPKSKVVKGKDLRTGKGKGKK